MAYLDIPLDNTAPAFSFVVDLENETFEFHFRWNTRIELWIFDIYAANQVVIQTGVPFYTGQLLLEDNVSPLQPAGYLEVINTAEEGVPADRFSIGGDVIFIYEESV